MENDLITSLTKAYMGQINSSLKISKLISSHGNEEELSADSLITGLVYRLMVPMEDKEIKESMEEAEEIINDIIDNNGNTDSSEEEIDENYDIQFTKPRKVKTNQCNCEICNRARVCLINYHTYEVNDRLAQIFKKSIDEACTNHKITI